MSEIVLEAQNLSRRYQQGPLDVTVLQQLDLTVKAGESVAIIGASGSGKSSLMHLLAGLDMPTTGLVRWLGQDIAKFKPAELGRQRNQMLGFVYQFHHLLGEFNALDNVCMPLWIRRQPSRQAEEIAKNALKLVGLEGRMLHHPSELSGGERQRVAIARALVTQPRCVLADEPTGNLDRSTADQVFQHLIELSATSNLALVVVTHDEKLAQRCSRQWVLKNGRLAALN
jgi:lipoprotein-releasing system ATP-binding protein